MKRWELNKKVVDKTESYFQMGFDWKFKETAHVKFIVRTTKKFSLKDVFYAWPDVFVHSTTFPEHCCVQKKMMTSLSLFLSL